MEALSPILPFGRLTKWLIITAIWFLFAQTAIAAKIVELSLNGGTGPAMADYLVRGIAAGQKADLILIRMDTPGGLDKSMRQIVQSILASHTPVVIYVTPSGARAASAGTYLLYASTFAAMAPGTHLGAASPVNLTAPMGEDLPKKNKKTVLDKKVTNDAVAYIRSLAQLRGRDSQFAEKAVFNAETMTATEALKHGVINFIAKNDEDLFTQLNRMTVTKNGHQVSLDLTKIETQRINPDWRMRFLQVITDPTIAYLLLLLGIYGIFFELINPGFVAPGVIGAVAMVLALYALQLLPVNYAGLALLLLGLGFLVAEAFIPSFGILGLGGTVAFVVGSILLINTDHQGYQIAWSAILAMAVVNLAFFIILFGMIVKSRRKPLQHGVSALVGAEGRSLGAIALEGQAMIRGEIWKVYAKNPIEPNKPIKVLAGKGLTLEVEEVKKI